MSRLLSTQFVQYYYRYDRLSMVDRSEEATRRSRLFEFEFVTGGRSPRHSFPSPRSVRPRRAGRGDYISGAPYDPFDASDRRHCRTSPPPGRVYGSLDARRRRGADGDRRVHGDVHGRVRRRGVGDPRRDDAARSDADRADRRPVGRTDERVRIRVHPRSRDRRRRLSRLIGPGRCPRRRRVGARTLAPGDRRSAGGRDEIPSAHPHGYVFIRSTCSGGTGTSPSRSGSSVRAIQSSTLVRSRSATSAYSGSSIRFSSSSGSAARS